MELNTKLRYTAAVVAAALSIAGSPLVNAASISIDNAGFENEFSGWEDKETLISDTEYEGSYAAKITGSDGKFEQVVAVEKNTDYELTAYIKGKGKIGVNVDGEFYSNTGGGDEYEQVTVTFSSGSATSVTISGRYSDGEVRFDEFALESLGTTNVAVDSTENITIENPSFEDEFSGWEDKETLISDTEYAGSYAAKINDNDGQFEQNITVLANTEYQLTAYIQGSGKIGALVGETIYSKTGGGDDYEQVTVSFNSGSETSVTIFGRYYEGEGRFDEFSLVSLGSSTDTDTDTDTDISTGTDNEEVLSTSCAAMSELNIVDAFDDGSYQVGHGPSNVFDDITTDTSRWASEGLGKTITLDLGTEMSVQTLAIQWLKGNERRSYFNIETSVDNATWVNVLSNGASSGTVDDFENIDVEDSNARYVRVVGQGNSTGSIWNSIIEAQVFGCETTESETEVPVIEEPVVEVPVIEEPVVEEPVIEVPVVEEPVIEVPVVEEPVIEEPVVEVPVTEEPVVEVPVIEEPVVEVPVTEEPEVEEPVTTSSFNWDGWKVTMPVNGDTYYNDGNTSSAAEIQPQGDNELCTNEVFNEDLSNDYFWSDSEGLHFKVPMNLDGKTPNTSYIRSELRELYDWSPCGTTSEANWAFGGDHTLTATLRMDDFNADATKVVVGQIHGHDVKYATIKLHWEGDDKPIRVIYNTTPDSSSSESVNLGYVSGETFWSYKIKMTDTGIELTAGGETATLTFGEELSNDWKDETFYFKAGLYPQEEPNESSTDVYEATFSQALISHGSDDSSGTDDVNSGTDLDESNTDESNSDDSTVDETIITIVNVENFGFEDSFNNWDTTDSVAISGDEYTGFAAAKVTGSNGKFTQTVTVSKNTDYQLSAYIIGSGEIGASVDGDSYSNTGGGDNYEKVSVSFNSGSETSVTIFGSYYKEEGRFDQFELVSTGSSSTSDNSDSSNTTDSSDSDTTDQIVTDYSRIPYDYAKYQDALDNANLQQTDVSDCSGDDINAYCSKSDVVSAGGYAGYESEYFYVDTNSGWLTFEMEGSSNRTELRFTENFLTDSSSKSYKLAAELLPISPAESVGNSSDGKEITLLQVHNKGENGKTDDTVLSHPLLRIVWDGESRKDEATSSSYDDAYWAIIKTNAYECSDTSHDAYNKDGCDDSYAYYYLGAYDESNATSFEVVVGNEQMIISVDGTEKLDVDISYWSDLYSYFKAGVYNQFEDGNSVVQFKTITFTEGEFEDLVSANNSSNTDSSSDTVDSSESSNSSDSVLPMNTLYSSLPPSDNFDLSYWNLSIPVDNGEGDGYAKATTIKVADLADYEYEDNGKHDYFWTNSSDGGMVFKDYIDGAITSKNTTYTRSELREMQRGMNTDIDTQGINANNWVFSSVPSDLIKNDVNVDGNMVATLAVNHVTSTGKSSYQGRVIIGQIHAASDEPIRLYYRLLPGHTKGSIYFAHEPSNGNDEQWYELIGSKDTGADEPEDGIKLNEKFSYEIDVAGDLMNVIITREDGSTVSEEVNMSKSGYSDGYYEKDGKEVEDYMYFKAGVYNQNKMVDEDDDGKDDYDTDPDDYVQATFYYLSVTH